MRDMDGSAAAPAARCRNRRRGSFILNLPLASHHSITSSARASSVGGISTPSVLAVLTLMINSSLVGNSMGKSATEGTSARTRQYRAQSQPRDARWPGSPRSRPPAQRPHRLVEGGAQVLWILDKEALAAEGLHYPVIAGAVNQCVGLQVEHRAFRDLRHARADAAIVQDDDLGREVVTDQRLHLHARKADRRVA